MLRFIARRLLYSIPVLFGILLATFVIARVIPGDPCQAALQERATAEACADFNERFGFNKPLVSQFGDYVGDVLTGDLGDSINERRPVTDLLIERLPVTLQLSFAALVIAVVIGVPLGVLAGSRRNSKTDVTTIVGANLGVSIPVFVLGLHRASSRPAPFPSPSTRRGASARTASSSSWPTSTWSTPCSSGAGTSSSTRCST